MDVIFRRADTPAPPGRPRRSPPRVLEPPVLSADPVPAMTYVLAATSVVALGAGIAFEAIGLSQRSALVSSCKPTRTCDPSAVDGARGRVLAGDVLLGAGGLLVGGALLFYLTRDHGAHAAMGDLTLRVGGFAGATGFALEGSL